MQSCASSGLGKSWLVCWWMCGTCVFGVCGERGENTKERQQPTALSKMETIMKSAAELCKVYTSLLCKAHTP